MLQLDRCSSQHSCAWFHLNEIILHKFNWIWCCTLTAIGTHWTVPIIYDLTFWYVWACECLWACYVCLFDIFRVVWLAFGICWKYKNRIQRYTRPHANTTRLIMQKCAHLLPKKPSFVSDFCLSSWQRLHEVVVSVCLSVSFSFQIKIH